jgi:spore maturation protein CgeB
MHHMTGASNKPFDYMAAGLALLVSDRPDWNKMFVEPGFARAVDPANVDSLTAALEWFLAHPDQRHAMAARGRGKIEADWNYDKAFAPLLGALINS